MSQSTANHSDKKDGATYTIMQVSEMTGVLSVTLRAWERRYGLIKPKRSEKGYRYYDEVDVEKIRRIVGWLNKGVAIGKVRPLLMENDSIHVDDGLSTEVSGFLRIRECLKNANLKPLRKHLSEALKTNTHESFMTQIFTPLDRWLEQNDAPDKGVLRGIFNGAVMELCAHLVHLQQDRKARNSIPVMVVIMDGASMARGWLSALEHSSSGSKVSVVMQPGEEMMSLNAWKTEQGMRLIIVGENRLSAASLKALERLSLQDVSVELEGSIAAIHNHEVNNHEMNNHEANNQ